MDAGVWNDVRCLAVHHRRSDRSAENPTNT